MANETISPAAPAVSREQGRVVPMGGERTLQSRVGALLRAALQGRRATWPADGGVEMSTAFLTITAHHGVQPLLYHQLRTQAEAWGWPAGVRDELSRAAWREAAGDVVREHQVRQTLTALSTAGVPPLLMKGAALSYTHYPVPSLRPRCDTDLLIPRAAVARADQVLRALGFERVAGITGDLVTHQHGYVKVEPGGLRHVYDVHWKIANPHACADLLTYEELAARAVAVLPLGNAARTLHPVDALQLACLHLAAHHYGRERLIWLADIHQLVRALPSADLQEFARRAIAKGLARVSARALALARFWFGTEIPTEILRRLEQAGTRNLEPSARLLRSRHRRLRVLLSDLSALPGRRTQLRWVAAHLFPAPAPVLRQFGVSQRWLLPALYVWRALRGMWRLGEGPEGTPGALRLESAEPGQD